MSLAILRYENVPGLKIAVDDQVRVSILDRRQDLLKELQPLANSEATVVAVGGERCSRYILERQIGLVILGNSRIEQPRDIRMSQARENLSLTREAFRNCPADQRRVHELKSHLTRKQAIDAFGQPYAAHSSTPQERQHAI